MSLRSFLKQRFVTPATDAIIDRIPKPVGTFGYDPWGYNTDAAKLGLEALKPLYEKYFRVEAFGLENVPKEGRVLVIANHSGQLPIDGMLIGYAMATNPHGPRSLRVMIERFFPTVPFLGNLMNELGGVVGDPENCARMLQSDEAIIVFPEGVRGSGKTWDKRYQLQRFGLGFMHLAITENTPILPVGVVGCEETMPTPFHLTTFARMFGIPYFPVTTPLPLPAKVRLYFGEPMRFEGPVTDEDDVALKVEQVKEAINGLIARGLRERQGWFK